MNYLIGSLIVLTTSLLVESQKWLEYLDSCPNQENPQHACPSCGSKHTVKNGSVANKKQKRLCKDCGRQFVENPTKKIIFDETKQLIDRLLLERISLREIANVTGVSLVWL